MCSGMISRASTPNRRQVRSENYERCYFDFLNKKQWKDYANLGDVLDSQLVFNGKVTRGTQTNWKWCIMAERWRNAKIMEPSDNAFSEASDSDGVDIAVLMKKRLDLGDIRKVTVNDKITDTSDLKFDPTKVSPYYRNRKSTLRQVNGAPHLKDTMKKYAQKWKKIASQESVQTMRSPRYEPADRVMSFYNGRIVSDYFPHVGVHYFRSDTPRFSKHNRMT